MYLVHWRAILQEMSYWTRNLGYLGKVRLTFCTIEFIPIYLSLVNLHVPATIVIPPLTMCNGAAEDLEKILVPYFVFEKVYNMLTALIIYAPLSLPHSQVL